MKGQFQMSNYSPLRYPGGKSALYPIISNIITSNSAKRCIYVEPFAGGASIACHLLVDDLVDYVVINDADRAVYSFWRTVVESPQWIIDKIKTTSVTVDEWRNQRSILLNTKKYSKELGFAMFFLNRTNRSGILDAGPIGGYNQSGMYKIDCRFNKTALIEKLIKISAYRNKIKIYNQDITVFLRQFLPQESPNNDIFIYFDPPYYENGQRLYLNSFSKKDHEKLKDSVKSLNCSWIMTYDDNPQIERLYDLYPKYHFSINYSLSQKKKGGELMIFKDKSCIPSASIFNSLSKSVFFDIQHLEANKMSDCRFCTIVKGEQRPENQKIAESENYFAISSVGALVEGWVLIVPKKHCCSMKNIYSEKEFKTFTNKIIHALFNCYGSIIAFEHGPNHEGSETSCGTNHAHIHLVPYHSLVRKLNNMNLEWLECRSSQVHKLVSENEYLFYCEPNKEWNDPVGKLHILNKPISQFFRKVIAEEEGIPEKFNYKTNPDITLTLKTIETLNSFFAQPQED